MEYLGFEYQPWHEGSCGAYSFGHAMNLVGIPLSVDEAKKKVRYISPASEGKNRASKWLSMSYSEMDSGTYEEWIIAGVRKVKCTPKHKKTHSPQKAKQFLDSSLKKGKPVIMTVNWTYQEGDGGHYLVCAGKIQNSYIIIDSSGDWIIEKYSWKEIEDRFVWFYDAIDYPKPKGVTQEWYYEFSMTAVDAGSRKTAVQNFGKMYNKIYDDQVLQEWWGYYLADILDCFPAKTGGKKIAVAEVIEQRRSMAINVLPYWFSYINKDDLKQALDHYSIVAEVYQFSIHIAAVEAFWTGFVSALIGGLLYDTQ